MHDINYFHEHEIQEHEFLGCCKDCMASLNIIKPHIMAFAEKIGGYTPEMLQALEPDELYRLYQILDDLAHMNAGTHLSGLILSEPEIRKELPKIRSYYTTFFSIHERHLADRMLASKDPWHDLEAFPLYPRYKELIKNQVDAMQVEPGKKLAFLGCGPVPMTLILMSRFYGIQSVGIDSSSETVALSRKVIAHLGLSDQVEIVEGDDTLLKDLDWDLVLVAALAEPKQRIFQNVRQVLLKKPHTPVIFRTYTAMKAVLYQPVQPEDIKGFKIVSAVAPTGRVNNTTVFLNVAQDGGKR